MKIEQRGENGMKRADKIEILVYILLLVSLVFGEVQMILWQIEGEHQR
jgi:hypothetical protein